MAPARVSRIDRLVTLLLLDSDATQVHEALEVTRIDRERGIERLLGPDEVVAFPR